MNQNEIFNNYSPTELCEHFGSPLYVYNLQIIQNRIAKLQNYLGLHQNTKFLYAIKANYNPTIVKEIIKLGCGIDAVSVEEVKLGLHCGAKPENIMFTGNNMTNAEMEEVQNLGVLQNIGSLSRLEKYGKNYPNSRISIRFNPNIGIASHESNITGGPNSKFGIFFQDVEKVKIIATKHNLQIVGVHQHIGSGWLRLREPILALDVILDIAKQFPNLEFVDVGGGFGVPYKPEENRLDLKTLGKEIKKRMDRFESEYNRNIQLRFEPGRYIVAESGTLLTKVNTIKETISRHTVVGTDTGMNHLVRPAMYDSYHPIVNLSNPDGMYREYDVVGNICECADYFARDRMLNEVREGDILAIKNAGAYGMSMATNYQFRPLPAEVLIDGENIRLIRKRQDFKNLIANF